MIVLRRAAELADKTRTYKVLLDGTKIGDIHSGEEKRFDVSPGRHTLQLKVDWCTSQPLEFEIAEETQAFECGSNAAGSSLAAFFRSKDYIRLSRTD